MTAASGRPRRPPMLGVTGGKGGTGKTTVAVNLAVYFAKKGLRVLLLDCDVDAPNAHLLLGCNLSGEREVRTFLPDVDEDSCLRCGRCAEVCRENALIQVGDKPPILFPDLCNGCEACRIVCPNEAIKSGWKVVGWTYHTASNGVDLITGALKPGEAESSVVVRDVRKRGEEAMAERHYDLVIVDTAPGAHCDVVRALFGADYAVAVTEPTPFGAHDLRLILDLAGKMGIRVGVALNRADITEERDVIREACKEHGAELLAEIPLDNALLECYARGEPAVLRSPSSPGVKALMGLAEAVLGVLGL